MSTPIPNSALDRRSDLRAVPQTFQEACDSLRAYEQEAGTIVDSIRAKGKQLVILRFRQGQIAHLALGMRSESYGTSIMDTLAERSGIHSRTLYQCVQFFRHEQFSGSENRLRQWMEEVEHEKGQINWSYCRNWITKSLPESHEKAEHALETQKEKLERKAEKLEHEAADLEREVMRRNESQLDEEALGIAEQARIVAQDARAQAERLSLEKPSKYRSDEYLNHVRQYGCLACGHDETDAHHVMTGGMATKTHDVFTIPLCRIHHTELHQIGYLSFEQKHSINIWQNVAFLMATYFAGIRIGG